MKPGIKTTEFWLTLVVNILGACMVSGIIPETHWTFKLVGAVLAGLATLGYTYGRSVVKKGNG